MRKPSPLEAFADNMSDAHLLVRMARAFENRRSRRMRRELREKVGGAIGVRPADWDALDCAESDEVFVTFLPGSTITRTDLADPSPLLRQALVAGCAATETYVADAVMSRVGPYLSRLDKAPPRLRKIPLTIDEWILIEDGYERRRRGLREVVVEPYVRRSASTAPNKIGDLLAYVGIEGWSRKVDGLRHVSRGTTIEQLERITERRNRIAHEGDRRGRSRAPISVQEVNDDLAVLESLVTALENLIYSPSEDAP